MSTGIGQHEFSYLSDSVYKPSIAICPYCGYKHCEADHVDVGVGLVQCGPYYCPECHASEISSLDTRKLTDIEKKTGWYEPGTPVSKSANTIDGNLVDHQDALIAYKKGLLDEKE